MENCIICGKKLTMQRGDKCPDCYREAIRQIFKEHPEAKQAFKESIDEMKKPENMKNMVDNAVQFMGKLQELQKQRK